MRAQPQDQLHPFAPVFNAESKILIVGSFPSVKSRQIGFYYGNPRNRFWPVIAALFEEPVPKTTEERRQFALDRGIALFDVLASCEIAGSSDASIRRAVPNDFESIFRAAEIRRVFANGRTACSLFERFVSADVQYLPSTSPANAGWSFERLLDAWKVVREFLE